MKKNFSLKNKISHLAWAKIWLFFHLAVICAFALSLFFKGGLNINASLLEMLPSDSQNSALKAADNAVSNASADSVFILVSHKDFLEAKKNAVLAYNLLKDSTKFDSISLYAGGESLSDVMGFLHSNRFNLLDEDAVKKIQNSPQNFAHNALAKTYSGFTLAPLDYIEEDLFLFNEENLSHYLKAIAASGTAFSPKDGVLAREFEEKWYVMIRAQLSKEGAKLAGSTNAVPFIYEKCIPLEKDGTRFVFFGTPFHSYKSSSSATLEISIISTISMIAVIVILLFVFKSFIPLVASVFSILLSVGTAFCFVHALWGKIHMITLVFGTSLIGSCIDYSLHYFINWKFSPELNSCQKIRSHLFNGLFLSLVSTEICFVLIFFAPFDLLKQMAVFSFTGILSSFLTVMGIFPKIALPPSQKRIPLSFARFSLLKQKITSLKFLPALIFMGFVAVLLFNFQKVTVHNDISNLYKMEGRIKDDTILAYRVIDYNPTNYLIIKGSTYEEVLLTEEKIAPLVPDSFVATSSFIPSLSSQKKSLKAASLLKDFAFEQAAYLGFDEDCAKDFIKMLELAKDKVVLPDSELPATLAPLLKILWLGKIDGQYYSVLLPSKISDTEPYKKIAQEFDNVFFENKSVSISSSLDRLTELILLMFTLAFVVIAIVMRFFYSTREVLKIISIPVLSFVSVAAVFVLLDLRIEFFCITGIILVFGLGLDYIIYKIENKENSTESFAIALSFLTTAISFGALALSSFVPVHVLGLSIFAGLLTAFICAML